MSHQCPSGNELELLVLGQLSDKKSEQLIDHLEVCKDCESQVEKLENLPNQFVNDLRAYSDTKRLQELPRQTILRPQKETQPMSLKPSKTEIERLGSQAAYRETSMIMSIVRGLVGAFVGGISALVLGMIFLWGPFCFEDAVTSVSGDGEAIALSISAGFGALVGTVISLATIFAGNRSKSEKTKY